MYINAAMLLKQDGGRAVLSLRLCSGLIFRLYLHPSTLTLCYPISENVRGVHNCKMQLIFWGQINWSYFASSDTFYIKLSDILITYLLLRWCKKDHRYFASGCLAKNNGALTHVRFLFLEMQAAHWASLGRVLMVDLPESKTCNQAEYLAVTQVSIQQVILYVASLKTFFQMVIVA